MTTTSKVLPQSSAPLIDTNDQWLLYAKESIRNGNAVQAFRSLRHGRMTTVSHGESTEKIDVALLYILRHISPKYSPFPNMKQFKKGQLPAFHDLYIDRSDIRLKLILGDEYENV